MSKLKFLGMLIAAVFVASAALATAASAATVENLPELKGVETRTSTGKNNGNTEFRTSSPGLEPVVCAKSKGEGTETSSKPPSGAFHITFEECTSKVLGASVKCTGLGDTASSGIILALGTWELVWDRKKGEAQKELTTAVLFKNEAVHFSCSVVLVEVLPGETLCLHLKPTEKAFTHEFHCLGETTGTNQVEEWSQDETTWHVPSLTAGVNHPTKHEPSIQLGLGTTTYLVEVFADV